MYLPMAYQYPLYEHVKLALELLVLLTELLYSYLSVFAHSVMVVQLSRRQIIPVAVATPPFLSSASTLPSLPVFASFSASPVTGALPLPFSAAVGFFSSSFAMLITKGS
jgi:hypothetical protein